MGAAAALQRRRAAGIMMIAAVGFVALLMRSRTHDDPMAIEMHGPHIFSSTSSSYPCCWRYVKPIPFVADRNDIGRMLQEEEGMATGVELGVQRGVYAETLLHKWTKCKKFILVDLWAQQENYDDVANVDDAEQEEFFRDARARLSKFEERGTKLEFMRMLTSEATAQIPNGSLDFVYVDARHDYCGVKEDIELYWAKLREGGILAGHDYVLPEMWAATGQDWGLCADGSHEPSAVLGAINDFAQANDLQVVIPPFENIQYQFPSFIVRKPTTLCQRVQAMPTAKKF